MSDEERKLRSGRARETVSLPFLLLPRTPSSSLLSHPCADAQGCNSTHLDNARKFRMKFTVADLLSHSGWCENGAEQMLRVAPLLCVALLPWLSFYQILNSSATTEFYAVVEHKLLSTGSWSGFWARIHWFHPIVQPFSQFEYQFALLLRIATGQLHRPVIVPAVKDGNIRKHVDRKAMSLCNNVQSPRSDV